MKTWESAEMGLAALRSHGVFWICMFQPEFVGFPSEGRWSRGVLGMINESDCENKHETDLLI